MNKHDIFMNGIIICVLILGIMMVLTDIREGFIPHGKINEVDNPLLTNYYPLKTPGGLSTWNYSSQWKLYPTWSLGSYKQETNNTKKWTQPCNGTAAPADMCGGLYDTIDVEEECLVNPPSRNCRRVNYYCS
tara:strand:+ start:4916 stop:5311 length:396 start_codon:yes stop_codon:yes gene_type:complete